MRLEAFIADLLYAHDCVVVPGFGGLVANYRTSRLNGNTHVILPPSKHVGFNKNLKANDGLLANHIAFIMGIGYAAALDKLDAVVASYKDTLNNDGRLVWEKIGVFFKDKSGQLQFIPDETENFLLSSYGLSSVQLKYVKEEKAMSETPIIPLETNRAGKRKIWKVAVAAALPLLLGCGLLIRNQMNSSADFSLASFNPFQSVKVIANYTQREETSAISIAPFEEEEKIPSRDDIKIEEPTALDGNNAGSQMEVAATKPLHKNEAIVTENANAMIGKHAVIGGAFKIKSNANRFLKRLKADGFQAQFAGVKNGMTLVAYGVYDTESEANNALQNIISTDEAHAWIKHF